MPRGRSRGRSASVSAAARRGSASGGATTRARSRSVAPTARNQGSGAGSVSAFQTGIDTGAPGAAAQQSAPAVGTQQSLGASSSGDDSSSDGGSAPSVSSAARSNLAAVMSATAGGEHDVRATARDDDAVAQSKAILSRAARRGLSGKDLSKLRQVHMVGLADEIKFDALSLDDIMTRGSSSMQTSSGVGEGDVNMCLASHAKWDSVLEIMKRFELLKELKCRGGATYVDHASGLIKLHHQVSPQVSETLVGKTDFERFSRDYGVEIQGSEV